MEEQKKEKGQKKIRFNFQREEYFLLLPAACC
jgi:hypothetical protein